MPAMLARLSRLDPRRVYFGWWIVLAAAVHSLVLVGVTQFGFGLFINPMRQELGWSVALLATGSSIRSFENGFMAPLAGYMVDRLGPKAMTLAGVALTSVGLLLFSQVHSLLLFYVSASVIAMGQSLGGGTGYNVAIVNWFRTKRAKAMGLARSGAGVGSLTVPPMVFLMSVFGWRGTLIFLAGFVLVLGFILTMFVKPHPEDMGYLPDGGRISDDPEAAKAASARPKGAPRRGGAGGEGMEVKEVLRTPAFYLMAVASSLRSSVHTSWLVLGVPHLQNVGFSPAMVGLLAGGYGATQLGWRLLISMVGDKLGRRRVLLASFLFQGAGMVMFAWASPARFWLVPCYFVVYGIGNAAWSTMDSTQIADYFGTKRYATLSGLKGTIAIPLGLATPVIAGYMFDTTGTYTWIWTVYAGVMASGGLCIWAIRRQQWKAAPAVSAPAKAPVSG